VGFCRTLRDLLVHPEEFFANLGREGWAEPLAFALIVSNLGLLWAFFWPFLVLAPAPLPPGDAAGLLPFLNLGAEVLLALMAGAPVLVLADLGVGGICWWGSVALVGADREFTPAWRIFCYAHGAFALAVIPCFGMLMAGVWFLVLLYCGVKRFYGISAGPSLGALALFLMLQAGLALLLCLGLAAALALLGCLLLLS
jgi:hypothetical protein